jgi:cob(I)alamin adenosyltransferase
LRIYTRTGDAGETGLFGGQRVLKTHPRVAAYGEVDELNAALGVCEAQCADPELGSVVRELQAELFVLGADLATPPEDTIAGGRRTVPRVSEGMIARLEELIDGLDEELPALQSFILPGGTILGAHLHLARTTCRRAERAVLSASGKEVVNPEVLVYLNRLSDLLFVLARVANARGGTPETPWRSQP